MVYSCDDTMAGSGNKPFPPTPWTLIVDKELQQSIKNELFSQYWPPLYCYLRRKGYARDQAKDLVQGFFLDVILGRQLFQKADRSRGRFRTLLLTALDRYATDLYRNQSRRQTGQHVPIHDLQIEDSIPEDPYQAFVYTWMSKILDQTIKELQEECCNDSMSVHWELFDLKFLRPLMEGTDSPRLQDICDRFDIDNIKKASNMIITVKRRFRQLLKRHLCNIMGNDTDVDNEIEEIIQILAK